MSYPSHNQAVARTRCPTHDGTAQAIRDVLAKSPEPLSRDKLALMTGIKPGKIGDALNQMVTRTGQVVSTRGPLGVVYALYEKQRKDAQQQAPGQVGRGWYCPEFRELRRDPFAAMKLALTARR